MNSINLIIGSMKSGKSSYLIDILEKAINYQKKTQCLVTSALDTRKRLSRKNQGVSAPIIRTQDIRDILNILENYEIICVDEAQFIKNLAFLKDIGRNKQIFIGAINGDSDLNPWTNLTEVFPIVESIIRLKAICEECGSHCYTFTYYDGKDKTSQIKIGDTEYRALCRKCYSKLS